MAKHFLFPSLPASHSILKNNTSDQKFPNKDEKQTSLKRTQLIISFTNLKMLIAVHLFST